MSCRRPAFATMPGIDKLPIEETLEDSPQVRCRRWPRTARGLARAWRLRCPRAAQVGAAARGRCLRGPRPTLPGRAGGPRGWAADGAAFAVSDGAWLLNPRRVSLAFHGRCCFYRDGTMWRDKSWSWRFPRRPGTQGPQWLVFFGRGCEAVCATPVDAAVCVLLPAVCRCPRLSLELCPAGDGRRLGCRALGCRLGPNKVIKIKALLMCVGDDANMVALAEDSLGK